MFLMCLFEAFEHIVEVHPNEIYLCALYAFVRHKARRLDNEK